MDFLKLLSAPNHLTTSGSESDDGCSSVKRVDFGSDDDEVDGEGDDESSVANPDELQRGHFFVDDSPAME